MSKLEYVREDHIKFLKNICVKITDQDSFFEPVSNKTLLPIAYYKALDMLLVLYKTEIENEYCAHVGQNDWPDLINPPNFGFVKCSTHEDALEWVVNLCVEFHESKIE